MPLRCATLSPGVHAAVDIAPEYDDNTWSYALRDDTSNTSISRSIAHCTAFEAGVWQGKFSPCANATPSRSPSFAYDALDRLIHDAYGQFEDR